MIKTGIYSHSKSNGTVLVIGEGTSSEKVECVYYIGLQDGKLHNRPTTEFVANVNIDGNVKPAFVLKEEIDINLADIVNHFSNNKLVK